MLLSFSTFCFFFTCKSKNFSMEQFARIIRKFCKSSDSKGNGRLALNFLNQIREFWGLAEHLNEPLSSYQPLDAVDRNVSGKLESPFSDPVIDRNTNDICKLEQLRNQNPHRIIIGHLNTNSIRNKFESLARFVGNNLDNLWCQKQK